MKYDEAKQVLARTPQARFHVIFPKEDGMAMDENGCRISMNGFVPTFKIDQAFEIARKFHGEVA